MSKQTNLNHFLKKNMMKNLWKRNKIREGTLKSKLTLLLSG